MVSGQGQSVGATTDDIKPNGCRDLGKADKVKTQLMVNETVVQLSEFAQLYVGSILRAIASSLGSSGNKITLDLDDQGLNLYSGDDSVPIGNDFASEIIESTVKGMLSGMKGVVWFEKITIVTHE